MLVLFYFRWVGSSEEFNEYIASVKSIADGIDGADFKGVFVPTSEWNAVLLYEATSFEKALEAYRTYIQKHGPHPKIPVSKAELLYTFKELGYPQ